MHHWSAATDGGHGQRPCFYSAQSELVDTKQQLSEDWAGTTCPPYRGKLFLPVIYEMKFNECFFRPSIEPDGSCNAGIKYFIVFIAFSDFLCGN
jgi:hypothetical protein